MEIEFYIFVLTDATGNKTYDVVGEPSDNICIGGIGKDFQYHQYDSYEGYHAYGWAEKLGMKLDCYNQKITI